MKRFLTIFFGYNMLFGGLQAQTPGDHMAGSRPDPIGIITGKVSDKTNGDPLPYANIVIYNQHDSSMVTGTMASIDGSFKI